jgi:hypothetical protein
MKILSIDALHDGEGWSWNSWHQVGEISKEDFEALKTAKQTATRFFESGYTTTDDMRKLDIDDDGYNVTLCEKKSGMPVFAIEYGPEY